MNDIKILKVSGSFTSLAEEEMMCVEGGAPYSYDPMETVFNEAVRHITEGVHWLCTPDNLREIGSSIRTACGNLVRSVVHPTGMHLVR